MAFKKRESQYLTRQQARGRPARHRPYRRPRFGQRQHPSCLCRANPETAAALETHNTALAAVDKTGNTLKAEEKALSKLSSKMLTGVGLRFGLDSDAYEQAGGTRESERRKPGRAAGKA